ncbi:MAG: hypothetical protein KJ941_08440 [Bacteroidetes bacterium]|nr:hypothetical protein [Bacteroidota bacterium]
MTKGTLDIALILSILIFISSCEGKKDNEDSNLIKKESSPKSVETKKSEIELDSSKKFGQWRIDSVAENNKVIDRLANDNKIQIFNFRKDSSFSIVSIKDGMTIDELIGTWEINKDSVLIFSKKRHIIMKYRFELIHTNILILNSGFEISSSNNNKPTFYLSKYKEKNNSNVFDPSK